MKSHTNGQSPAIRWQDFPGDHIVRQLIQAQLELVLPSVHGYCLVSVGRLADEFSLASASVVNTVRFNAVNENSARVDSACLPLSNDDVDAIFLPFELELAEDPHALLRESYRALRPGGKLIMCTLNLMSLWGVRRLLRVFDSNPLWRLPFYTSRRLMDWFSILDFNVKINHSLLNPLWLKKYIQGDTLISSNAYSVLGCINFIVAEKRVLPLTLRPQWRDIKSTGTVGIETVRKVIADSMIHNNKVGK